MVLPDNIRGKYYKDVIKILPISIFTSNLPGLIKASSIRSGLLVIPVKWQQRKTRSVKRNQFKAADVQWGIKLKYSDIMHCTVTCNKVQTDRHKAPLLSSVYNEMKEQNEYNWSAPQCYIL